MFQSVILTSIVFILFITKTVTVYRNQCSATMRKLATCEEFTAYEEPYDAEHESKECEHYFHFEDLQHLGGDYKIHFKVYVMAFNDANIYLWESKIYEDGKQHYDIVIGSNYFNVSQIRYKGNDSRFAHDVTNIPHILSPIYATPIIVRQNFDGVLEIIVPGVANPLLSEKAPDLHPKFVCFYAYHQISRWFYNCKEESDFCYSLPANSTVTNSNAKNEIKNG